MTKDDNEKRLDAIIDEASKLPIEKQESILAIIRGMLFTRKYFMEQERKEKAMRGTDSCEGIG